MAGSGNIDSQGRSGCCTKGRRAMSRMIFVNLPVDDLGRSRAFYEAVGFVNNPPFSDETAACMVWSNTIYAMLVTHPKWATFTTRPIAAAGSSGASPCSPNNAGKKPGWILPRIRLQSVTVNGPPRR